MDDIREMFPDASDEAVIEWEEAVMLVTAAAGLTEFAWLDEMGRKSARRFCRMVRTNWNGPDGAILREMLTQVSENAHERHLEMYS